jgi:hypothetical protein
MVEDKPATVGLKYRGKDAVFPKPVGFSRAMKDNGQQAQRLKGTSNNSGQMPVS